MTCGHADGGVPSPFEMTTAGPVVASLRQPMTLVPSALSNRNLPTREDARMSSSDREFDLVLYGATGFVGKLTAHHLTATAPEGVRIALAGRSATKLEAVRSSLPPHAHAWPLVTADAADPAALASLARRTVAIATTVGPYLWYGVPLVEACAEAGTHYADLTGEVLFMRRTAEKLHDVAAASGARIVHACGFDSIPSDLGVLLLHELAGGDALADTTLAVTELRGGLSGGTFASMKGTLAEVAS